MSSTPSKPGSSPSIRERRKQAVLTTLGRIIGTVAIIVMAGAVLQVAAQRMAPPPSPAAPASPSPPVAQDAPASLPLLGQVSEAPVSPPPIPPDPSPAIAGIERIETKRDAIAIALKRYFSATTIEEKASTVRDSDRVRPLMQRHYQKRPLKTRVWKDLDWTLPIEEPGLRLAFVQASFTDAAPVSVIIEETTDGQILVDWESSVRYSDFTWRDFLAQRPVQPTLMRVLASRPPGNRNDTYAAIETGMAVLTLRHPTEPGTLNASYNPHDPRMSPLLNQLEEGQWQEVPVTLRLSFPPKAAETNAVLITSIEGRGWLQAPQPRS